LRTLNRRVLITGLGAITALSTTASGTWEKLIEGVCGIRTIDLFDTSGYRSTTGAQVKHFAPPIISNPRELRRLSRCDQFGLIAAGEAIHDAGLDFSEEDRGEIGICLGGGAGGLLRAEQYRRKIFKKEKSKPSLLFSFPTCSTTDCIASNYKIYGPRSTIATACSSSATAIGYATDMINSGRADVMIAGGSESLCELTFSGFNALRLVDDSKCRPFDLNRKGLSLGEGAAILILEEYERARARGAQIYGEVVGYAITGDAYHMTSPEPDGKGACLVMKKVLEAHSIEPECINYINAHGTGTSINDLAETRAVKKVFGKKAYKLPISSIKSMVGHCLGAAGAVEALATILAIKNSIIPPTVSYETPDPQCDLDYVPNSARPCEITYAMSNSFAFGGNNTSLVFKKCNL
jgi:3-oxoacyl-[acyl-carrier-protein] synthase II